MTLSRIGGFEKSARVKILLRMIGGIVGTVFVLIAASVVLGLPVGMVLLAFLLAGMSWLGDMLAFLPRHTDFDGQIAKSRLIETASLLSGCTVEVVRLPEGAQATPFAVQASDTNWQPEASAQADWLPAEPTAFFIGLSDDKIGDFCDLDPEVVAMMAKAALAPDGWMLEHSTNLRRGYLYAASVGVAARVIIDR